MNIFFYINTISHGGAERVITNLATELSDRGHDCTIITSYRKSWEYPIGNSVRRISIFNHPVGNFISRNIRLIYGVRNIVKQEKPDILVTFMGEPNLRAAPIVAGTGCKLIMSVRNDPQYEYGHLGWSWMARHLFSFADGMVFQTEDAKAWFPQKIQENSVIIFNPVAPKFYEVELVPERKGIVTTGRLAPQKNHALLIKAFAKIANRVKDDLIIYGAGDQDALKQLIEFLGMKNRVILPGQCEDVPNTLKEHRLYVLSSDFEGMPNALMEAMAVGLPCISTDCPCGGPRMLFGDDLKPFLVPVGNVDSLAEMMLHVLINKECEDYLSTTCKAMSREFESFKIYDRWENYLYNIVTK